MTYRRGVFLVLVAATLWSLIGLALRQIDEAGLWAVLFWRSAGMVPVLAVWVAVSTDGAVLGPVRRTGAAGVLGGLGLVLAFAGAIHAIQTTTIANAVLLFAASPFFAAVLGWMVLGEPVRRATWWAIAMAMVGMAIMVGGGLSTGALAGNLAAIASACGFAVFTVALRHGRMEDMMPAVIIGGGLSMLTALVAVGVTGASLWAPLREVAIAVAMGAVLLALGMALYTRGSKVVPAAELTLLSMVEVLLAPVWVWLVLGETARGTTLLGGILVLGAIAFNAVSGARRKPPAPPMT